MPSSIPADETAYERVQRFNALTSWLHSRRYAHTLDVATRLARETPERPLRVAEVGCAVAKLYGLLSERFPVEYVGIDHDPEFCRVARARYGARPDFQVQCASAEDESAIARLGRPDLVCALEMIEHIPEAASIRMIAGIAALRPRAFVASVPIELGPGVWIKHVGGLMLGYHRHRKRRTAETFWAGLYQTHRLPPHGTGHTGWDWRWLYQTLRCFMDVREVRRSPAPFLPAGLNFSILFVAVPRPERSSPA